MVLAGNTQTKWRPLLLGIVVGWKRKKEKEANDNLERVYLFFVLVSTSGASDWQACEDSHWNKRTTFVFHTIVIYNPWTWKQSEDSLKISLTPKRSEFTGVQKLFLLWREIGDKIDHYISYRVFSVWSNKRCGGPQLSRRNKKSRHYKLYSRQNKINGKTKKTTWLAVSQRLLFASERVRRVTINKRNGDLCC